MSYCKYCGKEIQAESGICQDCEKKKAAAEEAVVKAPKPDIKSVIVGWVKKPAIWIAAALCAAAVLTVYFIMSANCDESGCSNKTAPGSDYCYLHKCIMCSSSNYGTSDYCFAHYLLYDDDADYLNNSVSSWDLDISNINVYSSSNYTYAEGKITNNSDSTVSFVKIKGSFKTGSGTVVDTDWTYAVGTEGLAPGESCKWKLSVEKDSTIKSCSVSILDYDY